jgi:short-subunit dehydrogenase
MTTALVTGASSGIGAGFADRLAQLGYHLVLVARDTDRLEDKATRLRAQWRVDVEVLPADLSTDDGCATVEERLRDERRPVDTLVNNAGFSLGKSVIVSDVDDEDRMLRVLIRAPMRLAKAALPGMLARDRGSIITVSSVAGLVPYDSYGAAKAWAVYFSAALSLHTEGTGIQAIALCPGLVRTEFHERNGIDVASVPKVMWLRVDRVVDECLRDLARGKAICIPSRRYRVLVEIGHRMPGQFAARIARQRGLRRPKRRSATAE